MYLTPKKTFIKLLISIYSKISLIHSLLVTMNRRRVSALSNVHLLISFQPVSCSTAIAASQESSGSLDLGGCDTIHFLPGNFNFSFGLASKASTMAAYRSSLIKCMHYH